jgi:hypothetical protein
MIASACSGAGNDEQAYFDKPGQSYLVELRGRRRLMAHDPVSAIRAVLGAVSRLRVATTKELAIRAAFRAWCGREDLNLHGAAPTRVRRPYNRRLAATA